MTLITRYLIKTLLMGLIFIALSLVFSIWLTQILRFLELVVDSGAPAGMFFSLLSLVIPRLTEIILPIATLGSVLFVYNKLTLDNELIVMRAAGIGPWGLIRPVFYLGTVLVIIQFILAGWVSPLSHAKLQSMRQEIKAEFSSLLIREGVFNTIGKNTTVYARQKGSDGTLFGLLIHQRSDSTDGATRLKMQSSTVTAEQGRLIIGAPNNPDMVQIILKNGSQQQRNPKTGAVSRLDFEHYALDITPEKREARVRWIEPDERTLNELLSIDESNPRDAQNLNEFRVEIHRRFSSPFLIASFCALALVGLMAGPYDRRGQTKRIVMCIVAAIAIQSLYMMFLSLASSHALAYAGLYGCVIVPLILAYFVLKPAPMPASSEGSVS